MAHMPLARAGRLGRVVPGYLACVPGTVLALAGTVGLAELAFRLQAVRNGASPRPVFGWTADPASLAPWLLALALLAAGALLLRRTAPAARAALQEASVAAAAP